MKLALALFLCAAAHGQGFVSLSRIIVQTATCAAVNRPVVLVSMLPATSGVSSASCAVLDSSLTLDMTARPWVLRALPQGGGNLPTFEDARILTGAVDGTNVQFSLPSVPSPASSLKLFAGALLMTQCDAAHPMGTCDYTITQATVTFVAGRQPQPGEALLAWYRR